MASFWKRILKPFQKMDEAMSKLVDKISPKKQERIARARPTVWLTTIMVMGQGYIFMPVVVPPLLIAYFSYSYLAGHCSDKVKEREIPSFPTPPSDTATGTTSALQGLSPAADFKVSAEKDRTSESEKGEDFSTKPAGPKP